MLLFTQKCTKILQETYLDMQEKVVKSFDLQYQDFQYGVPLQATLRAMTK